VTVLDFAVCRDAACRAGSSTTGDTCRLLRRCTPTCGFTNKK